VFGCLVRVGSDWVRGRHAVVVVVRSARGALPVFLQVGFPESPPAPAAPVSGQRRSASPVMVCVVRHPATGHGVGSLCPGIGSAWCGAIRVMGWGVRLPWCGWVQTGSHGCHVVVVYGVPVPSGDHQSLCVAVSSLSAEFAGGRGGDARVRCPGHLRVDPSLVPHIRSGLRERVTSPSAPGRAISGISTGCSSQSRARPGVAVRAASADH
jgi:hypothetical protein